MKIVRLLPIVCVLCLAAHLHAAEPASAMAGRAFYCTDNGLNKVLKVDAKGKVVWEYPAVHTQVVWALPDGNCLFSFLGGAREVTPDGQIAWEYKARKGTEVHSCQPLEDGSVMVLENGTCRLLEIGRDGAVRKEIIVPTRTRSTHGQFRIARKTAEGHYLIACMGENEIRELDGNGRTARIIKVPGNPFQAERLENGNTLIACGDGHKFIEVDPSDKVVWELDENDLPGNPLRFVAGFVRLPNGNTVICNWLGHGHTGQQAQVLEVTPEKKVVWQLMDNKQFKTISNICPLPVDRP